MAPVPGKRLYSQDLEAYGDHSSSSAYYSVFFNVDRICMEIYNYAKTDIPKLLPEKKCRYIYCIPAAKLEFAMTGSIIPLDVSFYFTGDITYYG